LLVPHNASTSPDLSSDPQPPSGRGLLLGPELDSVAVKRTQPSIDVAECRGASAWIEEPPIGWNGQNPTGTCRAQPRATSIAVRLRQPRQGRLNRTDVIARL